MLAVRNLFFGQLAKTQIPTHKIKTPYSGLSVLCFLSNLHSRPFTGTKDEKETVPFVAHESIVLIDRYLSMKRARKMAAIQGIAAQAQSSMIGFFHPPVRSGGACGGSSATILLSASPGGLFSGFGAFAPPPPPHAFSTPLAGFPLVPHTLRLLWLHKELMRSSCFNLLRSKTKNRPHHMNKCSCNKGDFLAVPPYLILTSSAFLYKLGDTGYRDYGRTRILTLASISSSAPTLHYCRNRFNGFI